MALLRWRCLGSILVAWALQIVGLILALVSGLSTWTSVGQQLRSSADPALMLGIVFIALSTPVFGGVCWLGYRVANDEWSAVRAHFITAAPLYVLSVAGMCTIISTFSEQAGSGGVVTLASITLLSTYEVFCNAVTAFLFRKKSRSRPTLA